MVLVPGKVVGAIDITTVPARWKIISLDQVPCVWNGLLLAVGEGGFWSSAALALLLWMSRWSLNGGLLILLLKG